MNQFGKNLRLSIFGESHGERLGVILDGCPAGIELNVNDFVCDLERRKGASIGSSPRKESDQPNILSGVFNGKSNGAPIMIEFENNNCNEKDYAQFIDVPRPSHADFVANNKFHGFNDYRGGGHFSGRLSLPLVAAGIIAKKIIPNICIDADILEIGGEKNYYELLKNAQIEGDSLGGIVECRARNLPIGLGEPFFDSIESVISHLVFAIPAIKGIEFGAGFNCAKMKGSEYNDSIIDKDGKTLSNNDGGINGGISNGNDLVFRVAIKPSPSIGKIQKTINLLTNKVQNLEISGRHDCCIALKVPVIVEAITAIAIADFFLEYRTK